MKRHLPNLLTLCNLLAGCIAIVFLFEGNWSWVVLVVVLGGVADLLDGAVARALGVSSPMGKELDSLADLVSFGLVPGVIVYQLLGIGLEQAGYSSWWSYTGFILTLSACLRLARFNIDTEQTTNFIGIPTPAMTLFIIGLFAAYLNDNESFIWVNPMLLGGVILLFSALMNAPISFFGLKFKHFKWDGNEIRYIFVGLSIVLLIWLKMSGLMGIILIYIGSSLLFQNWNSNKKEIG